MDRVEIKLHHTLITLIYLVVLNPFVCLFSNGICDYFIDNIFILMWHTVLIVGIIYLRRFINRIR